MFKITKRINQIFQKVDLIARKGKDGYLDYSLYLDELINNGEWSLFDDMMLKKYQINIRKYDSVAQVKNQTFDKVRFYTLDTFQQKLKELYISEDVYQNGYEIYTLDNNELLGKIYELEEVRENFPIYKDQKLSTQEKVIIFNLEAHRVDGDILTIEGDDIELIDKYKTAIDFLR